MNYHKALQVLDLPDPPTPTQLRKQFRLLALQYHPDRNAHDSKAVDKFRLCTEAYNYLLENGLSLVKEMVPPAASSASPVKMPEAKVEDLDDIFDDIFGFSREGRILGVQKPQDFPLTLVELAMGVTKKAYLESYEKCFDCKGSGSDHGRMSPICTYCFGAGQIQVVISGESIKKKCPKCEGKGRKVVATCKTCGGFGRKKTHEWQLITYPPALKIGHSYTLHSTDIKTHTVHEVFIKPILLGASFFHIESDDIVCEYPVDTTLNDGNLEVPTLWGWHEIKRTSPFLEGEIITLKGFGLFRDSTKKNRGDLKLKIVLLNKRSTQKRQKQIREVFTEDNPVYGSPKKGFFKWLFGF